MSALEFFTPAGQQVRTVTIDGAPWFVVADIAKVLGYRDAANGARVLREHHKGYSDVSTPSGVQTMLVTSEPGLNRLMLRSNASNAEAVQDWITDEVMPSIRKTGQFGSALPANFAEALELAAAEIRKSEALEARIIADAPKVEAFDALMDSDGNYSMEAVAKMLGIGRTTFFRQMRAAGMIQTGKRLPYQRYAHHFDVVAQTWRDSEGTEHPTFTTKVLPSALPFIRSKLGLDVKAEVSA